MVTKRNISMTGTKVVTACLLFWCCCTMGRAQSIALVEDGKAFSIEMEQTQTEVKAGWKIVDITLKSKVKRYLWGSMAKHLTLNEQPCFMVTCDTLLLSDLVLMRLKQKREYRSIPKAEPRENSYTRVELPNFSIEPMGTDTFLVKPVSPLPQGEYLFMWLTAPRVGKLEDWYVWPFSRK